jgi:hypothetical protein
MEMPAGIAAALDPFAAVAGRHATIARGMLDQHDRIDAYRLQGSTDDVVFPETTPDGHPSPDLRA